MEKAFGIPVARSNNYLEVFAALGIVPWEHTAPVMSMADYLAGERSEQERADAERFGPKSEVVQLKQPNGKPFVGFRSVGKNWATVFAIVPSDEYGPLIPLVGEWKHGAEAISICMPSGVPTKAELAGDNPMGACAKREFEEETGMTLMDVTLLSPNGIPLSGRQSSTRYFPYLGHVAIPIRPRPSKLDDTEYLALVLMPVEDWFELMRRGKVYEDCAASCTLFASLYLGLLTR